MGCWGSVDRPDAPETAHTLGGDGNGEAWKRRPEESSDRSYEQPDQAELQVQIRQAVRDHLQAIDGQPDPQNRARARPST